MQSLAKSDNHNENMTEEMERLKQENEQLRNQLQSKEDPYKQKRDPYAVKPDPYAVNKNSYNSAMERRNDAEHVQMGSAIGIVGALAMPVQAKALGVVAAKGLAGMGATSLAGMAAVPGGAVLLGIGAAAIAGGLGVIALKSVYKGIKSNMSALKNMPKLNYSNNPDYKSSTRYEPERTNPNSKGAYQEQVKQKDKIGGHIQTLKDKFKEGKDITNDIRDIQGLKSLSGSQKKELNRLQSDNIIRNAANDKDNPSRLADAPAISKELNKHHEQHNIPHKEMMEIRKNVLSRLGEHYDNQNINRNGKIMDSDAIPGIKAQEAQVSQADKQQKEFKPMNMDQSNLDYSKSSSTVKEAAQTTFNNSYGKDTKAQEAQVNQEQKEVTPKAQEAQDMKQSSNSVSNSEATPNRTQAEWNPQAYKEIEELKKVKGERDGRDINPDEAKKAALEAANKRNEAVEKKEDRSKIVATQQAFMNAQAVQRNGVSMSSLQSYAEKTLVNEDMDAKAVQKFVNNTKEHANKLADIGILQKSENGDFSFVDKKAKEILHENGDKGFDKIYEANLQSYKGAVKDKASTHDIKLDNEKAKETQTEKQPKTKQSAATVQKAQANVSAHTKNMGKPIAGSSNQKPAPAQAPQKQSQNQNQNSSSSSKQAKAAGIERGR
jgi:hypothetical protein